MLLPSGRELSFAPDISGFLETIFEEKSLAFQTLHFEDRHRISIRIRPSSW
jgi:hypothetical protein